MTTEERESRWVPVGTHERRYVPLRDLAQISDEDWQDRAQVQTPWWLRMLHRWTYRNGR